MRTFEVLILIIFVFLLSLPLSTTSYCKNIDSLTNSIITNNINDSLNTLTSNELLSRKPKGGLSYSEISTYGFTLQGNVFDILRIGATFFLSGDDYLEDNSLFAEDNFGLQIQVPILSNQNYYTYFFVGGGITHYTTTELTTYSDFNFRPLDQDIYSYGLGIGASVKLIWSIAIDFEIGYSFTTKLDEIRPIIIDGFNYRKYKTTNQQGISFGFGLYLVN